MKLLYALLLLLLPAGLAAQSGPGRQNALDRRVTVALADVTLAEALQTLAAQSGVAFAYSRRRAYRSFMPGAGD